VALVEGERQNFKITHAEDLEWARAWLRARAAPGGTRSGSA
jgi:2-C-methyl-D-erythritol 4-phosphate cytidylyltransferase